MTALAKGVSACGTTMMARSTASSLIFSQMPLMVFTPTLLSSG
jgi:hypothetical protein